MARIFRVNTVTMSVQKTNPPTLLVTAQGRTATPGWKHIDLVSLEATLSDDGILDLEFVGEPPATIVPGVITPVTAQYLTQTDVERIVGVMVRSRSNAEAAFLTFPPDPGFPTPPGWQVFSNNGGSGEYTTQAVGEENGTTNWVGEEGKTYYAGEEGTSFNNGEESIPGTGESDIIKMGEKNIDGEHNESIFSNTGGGGGPAAHFFSPFGRRR